MKISLIIVSFIVVRLAYNGWRLEGRLSKLEKAKAQEEKQWRDIQEFIKKDAENLTQFYKDKW